ncbi:N-formylglutamate amidohydrolase [Chelatococcus asaccharovorans]|uniref:Putative N-formylglutamate amidohydrolase n=1 Tax=Chelatococcus asaccharovorans TaxID=28210 RepID=A0A2V3UIP7_9HYPH|nr:N-formylglutamate amidohydrolase [Chelatococcus asaccharovorans]MBS7706643.1 N-formylglutamate amidohydrolase [Chelatococcus asaccharovorans]PXW64707.1 putative N-formylglutamate amidohydrolase [Chelatococcus asaccharovorans]
MRANPPIVLNAGGRLPGLIAVDHAGRSIPPGLGDLGLAPAWQDSHYFCDLGVAELAQELAGLIDVPIVLCDVSRLVIDVNRWVDDPRSIPVALENTPITANAALSCAEREARQEAVFWPYHQVLGTIWERQMARHARPFFFALHSCTRVFEGVHRPWDGGTIWHDDDTLSRHLLHHLGTEEGLVLGDNQPYSGRNGVYTVDWHSYGTGLPACGFEVTNDLLETGPDRARWACRLAGALTAAIATGVAA